MTEFKKKTGFINFFFHLLPTSRDFHSLQVENCGSNSRIVVDEDDNGKFRLERVNSYSAKILLNKQWRPMFLFQFEITIMS